MTDETVYCGIAISEDDKTDSSVSIISGEEIISKTVTSNKEIIEILQDYSPEFIAVDCGLNEINRMSEGEEELQEEGFIFTPAQHDTKRVRRFEILKRQITSDIDVEPEFLRFDPVITGRELAVDTDEGLKSLGINTSDINSSKEFDSVLGAITARFYEQGQFEDYDVIVPSNLNLEEG